MFRRTPSPAQLTSPPPTVKKTIRHSSLTIPSSMPSPEQIANGSLEELRSMVTGVISECRQARTEIAHHKFQYKMLQDEYCQAKDRMNLEMFFMQKDVEVKSRKEEPIGQLATPALSATGRAMSPGRQLVLDLRNTCQIFELENDELRHRLHDAKTVLLEREDSMVEENERLRAVSYTHLTLPTKRIV